MSKIIEHTYNGFKWLLVEVPEDGISFIIYQGNQLSYEHSVTGAETGSRTGFIGEELLPSGSWEVVGKADRIPSFQETELVESDYTGTGKRWKNYENHDTFFYYAKGSFLSLLRSHGLKAETTLILKHNG